MLGLAEQVRGHDLGVALAVGDDQNLTGPGHHVDAHLAEDLLFRLGHELVAGANDFVHLRHALGAIGQGGHRLGAAHPEDPVHPADAGGGQDIGGDLAVLPRGRDHTDLLHPRQLGRDAIHQDAGGIGRRAPGHIQAHPLQGQDLLAHEDALLVVDQKAVAHLALVEGDDAVGGPVEDLHQAGVGSPEALVDGAHPHLDGGQVHPVKFLGVFLQGGVPACLDVGQDGLDGRGHRVHRVLPGKDGLPVGLPFFEDLDHFFSASLAATCSRRPS